MLIQGTYRGGQDMRAIVTLTTDFGTSDGYVGAMKGVILGINADAEIVDITHAVEPQNIRQGALLFAATAPYFPPGTVHVVVVDPGVGSERRALALQAGGSLYVAPDNGVLTQAVDRFPDIRAVSLDRPEYWRPSVSNTFHGRDIFAPVAAHLSLGVPLEAVGTLTEDWIRLPKQSRQTNADASLVARIAHIDHFGNVVIDLDQQELSGLDRNQVTVEIAGKKLQGIKQTYTQVAVGELLLLINSSGFLEVAQREGSAARTLEVRVGETIRLYASSAESIGAEEGKHSNSSQI